MEHNKRPRLQLSVHGEQNSDSRHKFKLQGQGAPRQRFLWQLITAEMLRWFYPNTDHLWIQSDTSGEKLRHFPYPSAPSGLAAAGAGAAGAGAAGAGAAGAGAAK